MADTSQVQTMDKAQALNSFWGSFDLPAYDENAVPQDAVLPYITYAASFGAWGDSVILSASLWYRSSSWEDITKKSQDISDYIGYGGILVPFDQGNMWIKRSSTFSQRMGDPSDDMIRRVVLMINVEFLSVN